MKVKVTGLIPRSKFTKCESVAAFMVITIFHIKYLKVIAVVPLDRWTGLSAWAQ